MKYFLIDLRVYAEEIDKIFGKGNWKFGGSAALKALGLSDRNIKDLDIVTKKNHYHDGRILRRVEGKSYKFPNFKKEDSIVYTFGIILEHNDMHVDVFHKEDYGDTIKMEYFELDNVESILGFKHQAYKIGREDQKSKHYNDLKHIQSILKI